MSYVEGTKRTQRTQQVWLGDIPLGYLNKAQHPYEFPRKMEPFMGNLALKMEVLGKLSKMKGRKVRNILLPIVMNYLDTYLFKAAMSVEVICK